MANLLGDWGDDEKVQKILEHVIDKLVADLAAQVVPALKSAINEVMDGLEITVTVKRKGGG